MRESELKHGRVAMLAVVGWLVQVIVVHIYVTIYLEEFYSIMLQISQQSFQISFTCCTMVQ